MYFNDAKYSTIRCLPDGPFAGRLFQKDGNPVKRLDNEVPSFTMNSHELVSIRKALFLGSLDESIV
jgi:hypothetical protein